MHRIGGQITWGRKWKNIIFGQELGLFSGFLDEGPPCNKKNWDRNYIPNRFRDKTFVDQWNQNKCGRLINRKILKYSVLEINIFNPICFVNTKHAAILEPILQRSVHTKVYETIIHYSLQDADHPSILPRYGMTSLRGVKRDRHTYCTVRTSDGGQRSWTRERKRGRWAEPTKTTVRRKLEGWKDSGL